MSAPIDVQIIKKNGHPVFAVIPYDEYLRAFPDQQPRIPGKGNIPHEVVGLSIKKGFTLIRAWREYLGLTQNEVAGRMGVTQEALSQLETGGKKPRKATLEKLAAALGLKVEQIRE
jgi:DNA-binding XRE family transcriptional regulator